MFTIFLSMVLLTSQVDARRFGGGRSFGKSWSSVSSHNKSSYRSALSKGSNFASGKKNMLKGALMGLVAGGLIGSLLSGGGFHGLQGLDFLLIAGAAFFLFRMYQRRKMVPSNGYGNSAFSHQYQPQNNSFLGSHEANNSDSGQNGHPDWFKAQEFIEGAKKHFINLQKAWDQNDLNLIKSYCSPDLYENIVSERSTLASVQTTKVLNLDASLLDLIIEGDVVTAGIEFRATISSNNQTSENIIERWSIQHAKNNAKGDWLIVGIEQK